MSSKLFRDALILGACVLLGSVLVSAAATYQVTLDTGETLTLEKVDSETINVRSETGDVLGTLEVQGGGVEVFDANGESLGTAEIINPDALEMLVDSQ